MVKNIQRLDDKDLKEARARKSFKYQGTSGTEIYAGYYDEEYLQKIQGQQGIDIYDEMRRSDAQIRMLLSTVKNPILSAKWSIEPVDESDEQVEIKNFIDYLLFENIGEPDKSKVKTWIEFLEESLTFLDFGYSCFEIVHKIDTHPTWGTYIGLKDLAFRSQKSIETFNLDRTGKLLTIEQQVDGDLESNTYLDGRDLLFYSNNKEGDNYEGISALRHIYGNWFRKNLFKKLQAIGIERTCMGTPIVTLPAGIKKGDEDYDYMEEALYLYTQHQNAYMIIPENWAVEEFKLSFDPEKVQKVVEAENTEMSKAFLANFMELGVGGNSGSYSLASDLSDIFLGGIEFIGNKIAEKINRLVIPTLVKAKYGEQLYYPKLKVSGINDKAGKELAEVLKTLGDGGFIEPSDKLEDKLHTEFNLPAITEKDREAREEKKAIEKEEERVKEEARINSITQKQEPEIEDVDIEKEKDKALSTAMFAKANPSPYQFMKFSSETLSEIMKKQLYMRSDKFISNIKKEMGKYPAKNIKKSRGAVLRLKMPPKREYVSILVDYMGFASKQAISQVKDELDLQVKKLATQALEGLPSDIKAQIRSETEMVAEAQDNDLEKILLFTYNTNLDKGADFNQISKDIEDNRDKYIAGGAIIAASTNLISKVVNNSRNEVFRQPDVFEQVESFVYTNPAPVSAICKNLTGRVFTKQQFEATDLLPPNHHNCKSYIVAQTTGVKRNKPLSPVGLQPTGSEAEVEKILKSKTL